jgi:hypothetical protein
MAEIPRREFLEKAAAAAGLSLTGLSLSGIVSACSKIGEESTDQDSKSIKEPTTEPTQPPIPEVQANTKILKLYQTSQKETIINQANKFMNKDINNPERESAEVELMDSIANSENPQPGDVLLAIQACWTPKARIFGMEMFWRMSQSGQMKEFGVNPLSQEKIDWALENKIDPRTLLLAEIAFPIALKLLETNQENFLEAIDQEQRESIPLAQRIPNPGVLAKLMMTETQFIAPELNAQGEPNEPINRYWGHANIGNASALSQINTHPDYFPTAQQDLEWIAEACEINTGLPYAANIDKIPGSLRRHFDSGGAIGPQFMPINAKLFMKWYQYANAESGMNYPPPNPFDPLTGTVMAYLYIASEFYARQGHIDANGQAIMLKGNITRPGYEAGNSNKMYNAVGKWNPLPPQIRASINAGISYYNRFWAKNDPRKN